jgi:hypothetical protein
MRRIIGSGDFVRCFAGNHEILRTKRKPDMLYHVMLRFLDKITRYILYL